MVQNTLQTRTATLIMRMKEIKDVQGLSNQDILDMVLDAGEFTSLSTVKRVFADGSETQNFRYKDSIQPIARVLLGIEQPTTSQAQADNPELHMYQLEALKNVALVKDAIIDELHAANDRLSANLANINAERDRRELELKEESQRKIDYLKEDIKRKNKLTTILAIALAVLVTTIIMLLIVDKANPEWGYFRGESAIYASSEVSTILCKLFSMFLF